MRSRQGGQGASSGMTWALAVATRNRAVTLRACLTAAAAQVPPPSQIIVVDASDDSHETEQWVYGRFAASHPDIEVVYETAPFGSLTVQRQRAIELSRADLVFTFDDDTIMYPGCAAAIQAVYEADLDEVVVGVEASEWHGPPEGVELDDSADPKPLRSLIAPETRNPLRRMIRWSVNALAVFDPKTQFVPYDGEYPTHPMPPAVTALDTYQVPLLEGFRMTYRRDAISDLELEPLFLAYTPMEDFDLSYRASRRGALVASMRAGVYHHRARTGRLGRADLEAKSVLNLALLLRRHAADRSSATRRFVSVNLRRMLAGLLRDLYSRRWALPSVRGAGRGLRQGLSVLRTGDAYEDVYRRLQDRYL